MNGSEIVKSSFLQTCEMRISNVLGCGLLIIENPSVTIWPFTSWKASTVRISLPRHSTSAAVHQRRAGSIIAYVQTSGELKGWKSYGTKWWWFIMKEMVVLRVAVR